MLNAGQYALLMRQRFRTKTWCFCYKVLRKDRDQFRFTDHPHIVNFQGETYTPMGSGSVSAEARIAGQESDMEIVGLLDSTSITADDIRAGLYRGAELYIYIVNWRFPIEAHYSGYKMIQDLQYDGTVWVASIVGRARKLQTTTGRRWLRDCDYTLAQSGTCDVNLTTLDYIRTGVEVDTDGIIEQRVEFSASLATFPENTPPPGELFVDDFFRDGEITFTTGLNTGVTRVIARYTHANRLIRTYVPFPFDFADADEFTIKPGCDGLISTCGRRFENYSRHSGAPLTPGTNRSLAYPDQ